MVITYHGDNYFKIQSGNTTLLLDPTNQRSFKGARVVVNSECPARVSPPSPDEKLFWIDHQGEYEVEGILIRGWRTASRSGKEKTIYRVDFEGFRLAFLGSITEEPSTEFRGHLRAVDVVIIPAGGKPFISQRTAAIFVRQIEPAIIIPSLFKNLKPFLKELGQNDCTQGEKLVIKKKDIHPGSMTLQCLRSA